MTEPEEQPDRLDVIRTNLTGIGHDAEVEELFAYIADLEQLVQQYDEDSLSPRREELTWTRRDAERRKDPADAEPSR